MFEVDIETLDENLKKLLAEMGEPSVDETRPELPNE